MMKKTGIFYSFNTQKTKRVAKLIAEHFEEGTLHEVNIENITEEEFLEYDNYILGASTWWYGELPNHWDEFRPALEDLDLKGKKVALFGLGDQVKYPDNFGDAIGTLKEIVEECGAETFGSATTDGFAFDSSTAVQNGRFVGAMLDEDTQADQSPARVSAWVKDVKAAFDK